MWVWPVWVVAATAAAGALSRSLAQMSIHPLDTVKTRLQVSAASGPPQLRLWRAVMASPALRPRALAAWAGPAGLRDLFLGAGAALAGTLPSAALYFSAEAGLRGWMAETLSVDKESAPCRLVASSAAAALSALIRVPADVIKHRVQAYAYPSSGAAARHILATRGPAGLYAGFGATLLRDAPEIVIQFTAYRQLKSLIAYLSPPSPEAAAAGGSAAAAAEHLLLGGAAGAVAALATTPLDVLKTQLQCGAATSVGAALRGVLAAGGPKALFRGLAPRLAQTTLCSAIFFSLFEASKQQLARLPTAPSAEADETTVTAAAASLTAPLPYAAMFAAAATGGGEQLAALAPWGMPPPLPLPPSGRGRRRSSASGSGGSADAAFWAVAAQWGQGPLAPVAEYAYAYAGAAVPPPSASPALSFA
ncbi:hypothetical protein GPECTOR_18g134 [Gonium pectorale]|uniref:Uncharacterized protein n=1 Tax=Gonium pectorale TaxID=33097 RepID=A0A150GJJ0_GONPE|nr:hypothetical protein GPECTOR_18g134 [Gonium pectorale]|eukprot:KXZ49978.1 hypothetical protein GPECTOR_18g134 [Gonium pectorale]